MRLGALARPPRLCLGSSCSVAAQPAERRWLAEAEGAGPTARVPTRWWRQVRGPGRAHPASVRLQLQYCGFMRPPRGRSTLQGPLPLLSPDASESRCQTRASSSYFQTGGTAFPGVRGKDLLTKFAVAREACGATAGRAFALWACRAPTSSPAAALGPRQGCSRTTSVTGVRDTRRQRALAVTVTVDLLGIHP